MVETISQVEVSPEALLAAPKGRVNAERWMFPPGGEAITIPLQGANPRRDFYFLSISTERAEILSAQLGVVLMRMHLSGRPFENPDGSRIAPPFVCVYRDALRTHVATPLVNESRGMFALIGDFMFAAGVDAPPFLQGDLFG